MSAPRRHPIPPPPHPDAELLTFEEAAGFLRTRRRAIDELRRRDGTFPRPVLVAPGLPRLRRSELMAWLATRPTGWTAKGGPNRHKEAQ
jgi:predicted DNA-binding transcriptional regulator AlpA